MPVGELEPTWRGKYRIPQSLAEPAFLGWATSLKPFSQRQLLNEIVQEGMTNLGLEGIGLLKFVDVRGGTNNDLVFSRVIEEQPSGSSSPDTFFGNILMVKRSFLAGEPFNGLIGRLWPAIDEVLHEGVRRQATQNGVGLIVPFPISANGRGKDISIFPINAGFFDIDLLESGAAIETTWIQEGLTARDMWTRRRDFIMGSQTKTVGTGATEQPTVKSREIRILSNTQNQVPSPEADPNSDGI